VQLAEVDALLALDAGDDDVGGVAEDAGSDDGQRELTTANRSTAVMRNRSGAGGAGAAGPRS
jgi:hypothetical protein